MSRFFTALLTTPMVMVALAGMGAVQAGTISPQPHQPRPAVEPRETARAWFDAVAAGDVDGAMALSAVPFLWDGKVEVLDRPALRDKYADVKRRRGARKLVPDKVTELPSDTPDAKRYCGRSLPLGAVVVQFWIHKQHIGVCVIQERVVGFSDS